MNSYWKRLWTEINLDNLIFNFNSIRQNISSGSKICCVVKANAYGHHAPRVAQVLEEAGADWFAVSNIEEALQLREAAITAPVLILGYTPADCAEVLARYDISQCVYSLEYAHELSHCAVSCNCRVKAHIKADTGMGRLGFRYDAPNVLSEISEACRLDGIAAEGIFTHFAAADCGVDGKDFTYTQYERFANIVSELERQGIVLKYKHCANSAAAMDYPELQLDMVRVGIILYGLLPSHAMKNVPLLKPVMSLKTLISHVKTIDKGATVSYGCDFVAERQMKIATVPMGYADGFRRSNDNGEMLLTVRGQGAPIVGRICMDQLMLDVSNVEGVSVGDEVTVFGDGETVNTVDDLAKKNGTINYEIICSVGKRVPRVFIKGSKVEGIHLGVLDVTVN